MFVNFSIASYSSTCDYRTELYNDFSMISIGELFLRNRFIIVARLERIIVCKTALGITRNRFTRISLLIAGYGSENNRIT